MSGSLLLIYMILSRRKSKLTRPKNRFMLMMSIFDVLHATSFIAGTMAIPRESGIYGAIGNSHTCTAQGFIAWLGFVVPLYNNSLNLFYLLTIKYSMDSTDFAQKYEPFCHLLSTLLPITSGIVFVYLDWVHVELNAAMCYVNNMAITMLACSLLVNVVFLVYTMTMISHAVASQSERMVKYKFGLTKLSRSTTNNETGGKVQAQRETRKNHSTNCTLKESVRQAQFYTLAFLMTFMFPAVEIILTLIGIPNSPFALRVLTSAFYPLQGFWNCLFYIRPGVNFVRRRDPDKSLVCAILEIISNSGTTPGNPARVPSKRSKLQLTSSSLANNIDMNLQEMINGTGDCNSHSSEAPPRVENYYDSIDDEEGDHIKSRVDDDVSKITPDLITHSIDITVDSGASADCMSELTATREESLSAYKFLAPSKLVESEGCTCGVNFDSEIQKRKRESDAHMSTRDEMKVSEDCLLNREFDNNDGNPCSLVLQKKFTKAKKRMSLVSLASVLSDTSLDSL